MLDYYDKYIKYKRKYVLAKKILLCKNLKF